MGLARKRRHAIEQGFLQPRVHAPKFARDGSMVPLCGAGRSARLAQTRGSESCEECLGELAAIEARKARAEAMAAKAAEMRSEFQFQRLEIEATVKGRRDRVCFSEVNDPNEWPGDKARSQ